MNDGKREMRLAMARRYEEGGLTKARFCELEGVSLGNLDYWRRQAGSSETNLRRASSKQNSLNSSQPSGRKPSLPRSYLDLQAPRHRPCRGPGRRTSARFDTPSQRDRTVDSASVEKELCR